MDYIIKLPLSDGHDSIWVIVDRLTKRIHLIPCIEAMTAPEAAILFKKLYQRFHGLPDEITSDRDKIVKSTFWSTLMEIQHTKISLTTAYRKSGDGQSKIVIVLSRTTCAITSPRKRKAEAHMSRTPNLHLIVDSTPQFRFRHSRRTSVTFLAHPAICCSKRLTHSEASSKRP